VNIDMKEALKINAGWIITLAVSLVSLGAAYNGIGGKFDTIGKQMTALESTVAKQDARILKIEGGLSVMQQVEINTRRLDTLERLTSESKADRAAISAGLDNVKRSIDQLINMHLKNP
jgi:Spy/CpxP family protein refolding chaperone